MRDICRRRCSRMTRDDASVIQYGTRGENRRALKIPLNSIHNTVHGSKYLFNTFHTAKA